MKLTIVAMPRKITDANRYSTLLSKVASYIQAVEEDRESEYHITYLKSLKKQIAAKDPETCGPELHTIHDMLTAFLDREGNK